MWVCYCASQLLAQNCHKRQMTECPKSPEWDQKLSHMLDWPFPSLCKKKVLVILSQKCWHTGGGFLQLCFVTQWKHCTIGELEAWPEAPTNRSPCLLVAPSCNPSQAPLCVFLCLYCACLCVFVLLWHIWKQDELTIWKVDFYRCSWSFKCKF